MLNDTDYEQTIGGYGWDDLLGLWRAIETGDTPGWAAGKALEYLVLRAFQIEGAEVRYPYRVHIDGEEIEQIDGVVYSDGLACLVECKDQAQPVNVEPIAKMRNQLLRRPGVTVGIIFSRRGFTDPANSLTRFLAPQTILLWSGREIAYALRRQMMRQALIIKHRGCIEEGLGYYNIMGTETGD